MALFSGLLFNTPEAISEGKIEYQFKTYGGVTVVFIKVKLDVGNLTERLNCYAQVIAECDGICSEYHQFKRSRLTIFSLRLDELSERIQHAHHSDIMRWGILLFLQIHAPTIYTWITTVPHGQFSRWQMATTH